MYHLVVAKFQNEKIAEQARRIFLELHHDKVLNIEDINIATKQANGYVKLFQQHNLIQVSIVLMTLVGLIIGIFSKAILFGVFLGMGLGLLIGVLMDSQGTVSDDYARHLASRLPKNKAELFILSSSDTELISEHLENLGGIIVKIELHKD